MTHAYAAVQPQSRPLADSRWIAALSALAVGLAVFGLAFRTEIGRALDVWISSTAYNHCFLILPISAYLVWERRAALLAQAPRPTWWPLLAVAPVGLAWLLAERAGIMEGRQIMAMTLLQLLFATVLGFRAWRPVAFALLYLYFLVPSGAFLVPALQRFTEGFAVLGLQALGIPVYSDGLMIEVPGAAFIVAEACAGLRFLIASIALGALYGYMMYRSYTRRGAFLAVSIVVPIIANGFRVLGIAVLGYLLSSAEAATADHLIYGWVFFSLVSLALILLGLPFRQPPLAFPTSSNAPTAGSPVSIALAAGIVIASVAILTSPAVADRLAGGSLDSLASALRQPLGR